VYTNSTKRVFFVIEMAQFDSLIVFVLILSLIFVLILHYDIVIEILVPSVTETKKFTEKKTDERIWLYFLFRRLLWGYNLIGRVYVLHT
jgi:hypothetical protein